MWQRRFAILRICAITGDLPHGGQRRLAERFKVNKSVISRDIAWARKFGCFGGGIMPRCSYRRRTVTVAIEWINPMPAARIRAGRRALSTTVVERGVKR
jgi:hypothetical protein